MSLNCLDSKCFKIEEMADIKLFELPQNYFLGLQALQK